MFCKRPQANQTDVRAVVWLLCVPWLQQVATLPWPLQEGRQSWAGTQQLVPRSNILRYILHSLLVITRSCWPSFSVMHQPFYVGCLFNVSPGLPSAYSTLCPQSNICMVCTYFITNSNHSLIQHWLTGFMTENPCLFCAVWISSLNIILVFRALKNLQIATLLDL